MYFLAALQCRLFLLVHKLSSCSTQGSSAVMWALEHTSSVAADLVAPPHVGSNSPAKDQICIPWIRRWIPNHWTTNLLRITCLVLTDSSFNTLNHPEKGLFSTTEQRTYMLKDKYDIWPQEEREKYVENISTVPGR